MRPSRLDTWASSWLWPFATMGWPDETAMREQNLATFYPTSTLVTGPDIIFFWVARMIMAGLEFIDESTTSNPKFKDSAQRIPFRDVYFTGIIRDSQGRIASVNVSSVPGTASIPITIAPSPLQTLTCAANTTQAAVRQATFLAAW
jgi:valyl-tRNA synthetase